jgi:hypothetical protein
MERALSIKAAETPRDGGKPRTTMTTAIPPSTRPRPDMVMGIAESIFTKGMRKIRWYKGAL